MNTASLSQEHLSIGLKTFSFEIYRGHLRFFILRTISTCRFGSSMNTIFWTLFGQIDESSFKINESGYGAIWKTGMTLFGAFNIVAVLVALNMLRKKEAWLRRPARYLHIFFSVPGLKLQNGKAY